MSPAFTRAIWLIGFVAFGWPAHAQFKSMPVMPMPMQNITPLVPNLTPMPNTAPMPIMPAMPAAPAMPMPGMPEMPEMPAEQEMPLMPAPSDGELTAQYQKIVRLYEAGKYDEAVPLADDFLSSMKSRFGDDNSTYAAAIGVLARLYQAQGHFEDAETYVKRELAIDEREFPPEHPNIAGDLGALGQLYQDQGRLDDAEPLLKRALAINEKSIGSDPASVGRALNNLAWLYQEQGRYVEAEPLVTRSLSTIEKALGSKHADYARALDTLAKVFEGEGRVNDAEPLYRQAIAILEVSLGLYHESVAASRENLGGLIKSLGRLDEAEPLLKKALETKERVYGRDHPNVANSLSQLGDLYRQQGKGDEAESLFQRALAIRKATIREIPVYFATDRIPDKGAKTVTFGGEQSETLTFGQASVMVAKPEAVPARALSNHAPLTSATRASETPRIETTEVARLAIRNITVLPDAGLLVASAQQRLDAASVFPKQAFVFVHGFNVSFENALRRTAQIAYDLNFDGAPFLFSWPSGGGLLNYFSDRDNAETAANHLEEFLEKVVAETNATKIHLIAHSMGNVVLLDALEKIKGRNQSRQRFCEIILHSPDVGKNRFRQLIRAIDGLGTTATLYESNSDRALGFSAWIWGARAGALPAVVAGLETIDTTAAGSNFLGLNHDLYATNPVIFNDMRLVLELGRHPPDKRSSAFEATTTKDGTYWLYRRPTEIKQPSQSNTASMPDQSTVQGTKPNVVRAVAAATDTVGTAEQLPGELKGARAGTEFLKRDNEELRQQLEQERRSSAAAEDTTEALRTAAEVAERTAQEALRQVEQERSARHKAERAAMAARYALAHQRALDAVRLQQDKENETAATDDTKANPEKAGTKTETQGLPLNESSTQPTTSAAAPLPAEAEPKKAADHAPNARTGTARKRRRARAAQKDWPFNAWN